MAVPRVLFFQYFRQSHPSALPPSPAEPPRRPQAKPESWLLQALKSHHGTHTPGRRIKKASGLVPPTYPQPSPPRPEKRSQKRIVFDLVFGQGKKIEQNMRLGIDFVSLRKNAISFRLETLTVARYGVLQSGIVAFGSEQRVFKNVRSTFGSSKI